MRPNHERIARARLTLDVAIQLTRAVRDVLNDIDRQWDQQLQDDTDQPHQNPTTPQKGEPLEPQ